MRTANEDDDTPMIKACENGHLEVAQWLFGSGAAEDVRTTHFDGSTPIILACSNGHLEVAKWLFDAGAAEDVRTAYRDGQTPMHWACTNGHLEVAKWLTGAGAAEDVRTADRDGNTPMLRACENGHLEVAQWLFSAGAAEDVRTADEYGDTPMYVACQNGHLEVAQWLTCNGAFNSTATGHIDASVMDNLSSKSVIIMDQLSELQSAINAHIENHSNFTTLILPAVCAPVRGPPTSLERTAPHTCSQKRPMRTSPSTCHLPKICGLEDSVVALIADFAGVVRGRQLQNLREAYECLSLNN